jgi:hypothetical protein
MQLFQNRAGLKKAYADLKDEFHLLRDRLKQQEGATIRVQEQLDALGDLLGDPKTGFSALGVLSAAGAVEDLPSAAVRVRHRPGAPAGGARDSQAQGRHDADQSSRLADVGERLLQAQAASDMQRQAVAAAQASSHA